MLDYLAAVTAAAGTMAVIAGVWLLFDARSGMGSVLALSALLFPAAWAVNFVGAAAPFVLAMIAAHVSQMNSRSYWPICGALAGLVGAILFVTALRDAPQMMWASPNNAPIPFWRESATFSPGFVAAGVAGGLVYGLRARRRTQIHRPSLAHLN